MYLVFRSSVYVQKFFFFRHLPFKVLVWNSYIMCLVYIWNHYSLMLQFMYNKDSDVRII